MRNKSDAFIIFYKYLMKDLPILYDKKDNCCGCGACYAICPQGAIIMHEDEEGFDYPVIKESKCVRCYLCLGICPIKKSKTVFHIIS